MKTVEVCLDQWQERMKKTGERQIEISNTATLTLKVRPDHGFIENTILTSHVLLHHDSLRYM